MKYSANTYQKLTEKIIDWFLHENEIESGEVTMLSILPDLTYARFKVKVQYQDAWMTSAMKIRVQFMDFGDDKEMAYLDIIRCEGDQAIFHFIVDTEKNDVIDPLTGEVICRI